MILYKKVPGKKSFYIEKWMGIKDAYNFTTMGKKRLDNKTPLAILNMQMYGRKLLLCKRLRLDLIFTRQRTFSSGLQFLWSYFLRLYWQPSYFFRKKVLVIFNTVLYFQWHFFLGLQKIVTFLQKFLFPGFFSRNFFFRWLTYKDSS